MVQSKCTNKSHLISLKRFPELPSMQLLFLFIHPLRDLRALFAITPMMMPARCEINTREVHIQENLSIWASCDEMRKIIVPANWRTRSLNLTCTFGFIMKSTGIARKFTHEQPPASHCVLPHLLCRTIIIFSPGVERRGQERPGR